MFELASAVSSLLVSSVVLNFTNGANFDENFKFFGVFLAFLRVFLGSMSENSGIKSSFWG